MTPLASIITPALNAEKTIARSLQSALKQSYDRLLIVVIDASPNDLTEKVVRSIGDGRIRYLRQDPDTRGQAAARNQGIRTFASDLVTFLDADDYYEPTKVATQVQFLLDHPHHGAVYCDVLYHHADTPNLLLEGRWPTPAGRIEPVLFESNVININTLMLRRSFFQEGVAFDEKKIWWPEDWQFCLRLASRGCLFGHAAAKLVHVELRETSNAPFDQMHVVKKNTLDMLADAVSKTTDPLCAEAGTRAVAKLRRSHWLACLMAGRIDLARQAAPLALPYGARGAAMSVCSLIPRAWLRKALVAVWKAGRRRHYKAVSAVCGLPADC